MFPGINEGTRRVECVRTRPLREHVMSPEVQHRELRLDSKAKMAEGAIRELVSITTHKLALLEENSYKPTLKCCLFLRDGMHRDSECLAECLQRRCRLAKLCELGRHIVYANDADSPMSRRDPFRPHLTSGLVAMCKPCQTSAHTWPY